MKQEQQQQAQNLYFQTDLSKAEIASMLGISRRTIHYWAHDNNWDQIKKDAAHMPSILAGNCYHIMAKMQEDMLSEKRTEKAPTWQEVNALYKLTLTISKLQSRCTLNETLEMGTHFMEFVNDLSPQTADLIKPFIDSYIISRAKGQSKQLTIPKPTDNHHVPTKEEQDREALLDLEDLAYWSQNPSAAPTTAPIEIKTTTPQSAKIDHTSAQTQTPISSLNTFPKNENHLNRAQRRHLARTKAAA